MFSVAWAEPATASNLNTSHDQKVEALWEAVHHTYPYTDATLKAFAKHGQSRSLASETPNEAMRVAIKKLWLQKVKAEFTEAEVDLLIKVYRSTVVKKSVNFNVDFWSPATLFPVLQQAAQPILPPTPQ